MIPFCNLSNDLIKKIFYRSITLRNNRINNDISNYVETLDIFIDEYSKMYSSYMNEYLDYMLNDIIFFVNQNNPTSKGYCDNFYKIWRRNKYFSGKSNNAIANYVDNQFEQFDQKRQINIYWGLLKPSERYDCILISFAQYI